MKSTTVHRFSSNQAYWPISQVSAEKSANIDWKKQLNSLLNLLLAQLTNISEPRVWKSHDAAGHLLWNAYDGASDRIIRNASETEVRAWCENRYQF